MYTLWQSFWRNTTSALARFYDHLRYVQSPETVRLSAAARRPDRPADVSFATTGEETGAHNQNAMETLSSRQQIQDATEAVTAAAKQAITSFFELNEDGFMGKQFIRGIDFCVQCERGRKMKLDFAVPKTDRVLYPSLVQNRSAGA